MTSPGVRALFTTRGITRLEKSLAAAARTAARLGTYMPSVWNYETSESGFAQLHAYIELPEEGDEVVCSLSFTLTGYDGPEEETPTHHRLFIVDGILWTEQENPSWDPGPW